MFIWDKNGKRIEVSDLEKAIEIAEAYTAYHRESGNDNEMDEKLQEYWSDIYLKLLQLKSDQENEKNK